jgi:hypothetical protein
MANSQTLVPDQEPDRNDGKEWSSADLADLALLLKDGGTVESAAFFLCREGTVEEVRRKALELGRTRLSGLTPCLIVFQVRDSMRWQSDDVRERPEPLPGITWQLQFYGTSSSASALRA